jgi:hypothetical protein
VWSSRSTASSRCSRSTVPDAQRGLAHRINRRILGGTLTVEEEFALQYFVDALARPLSWNEVYEAIALGASMPGFQWY